MNMVRSKFLENLKGKKGIIVAVFIAFIIICFSLVVQKYLSKSHNGLFLFSYELLSEKNPNHIPTDSVKVPQKNIDNSGDLNLNVIDPFNTAYKVTSSTLYLYGKAVDGADVASFEILEEGYAKDKNHVYFGDHIFDYADPKTFSVTRTKNFILAKDKNYIYFNSRPLDSMINVTEAESISWSMMKDKTNVYYISENNFASTTEVLGADAGTFEYVGTCASVEKSTGTYYKDKNHVYVEDKIIPYIDAPTFEFIGNFSNKEGMGYSAAYAKDKNRVYFGCGSIAEKVDVKTFENLGDGYAKDAKNVFYISNMIGKDLEKADVATFQKIDDVYAKDKYHIYFEGSVLTDDPKNWKLYDRQLSMDSKNIYFSYMKAQNIDRATAKVLKFGYVQDKNGVYSFDEKIKNIDVETFKPLSRNYVKDKNNVYRNAMSVDIIKGADPQTFIVLDDYYAKDKSRVYSDLFELAGADTATFEVVGYGYAKDKNKVYGRGGSVIINVDIPTFKAVREYVFEDKNYIYTFDGKPPVKK